MHENLHDEVAAGAVHQVEDNWLPVIRDVPTAALSTYLNYLTADRYSGREAAAVSPFAEIGRQSVRTQPALVDGWVESMLDYFDAHGDETEATYPCAAILAGIVLELVGDEATATLYASHLALASHGVALDRARRGLQVRI
jgi:hypothetical protein